MNVPPDGGPGGRSQAPVIRVLSWNRGWRHGPWERRQQAIEATLAEVGPDVCGLQEVWGGLRENLGFIDLIDGEPRSAARHFIAA